MESPEYFATMECCTGARVDIEKVAFPVESKKTGFCISPSIINVTEPFGVIKGSAPITNAVNVTFLVNVTGFTEDVTIVVDGVAAGIT